MGDAFRTIDQDRSGSVDKQEMQAFFRQFSLPEETASLLFDYLDRDESGELDYVEFMRHFGPIIQPAGADRVGADLDEIRTSGRSTSSENFSLFMRNSGFDFRGF